MDKLDRIEGLDTSTSCEVWIGKIRKVKVELIKLDGNLNEVQKYSVKSDQYPLGASTLKNENGTISATVDVITGCSICTNTFELTFNDSLNYISVIEIAKTNSTVTLSPDFIQETFIK